MNNTSHGDERENVIALFVQKSMCFVGGRMGNLLPILHALRNRTVENAAAICDGRAMTIPLLEL